MDRSLAVTVPSAGRSLARISVRHAWSEPVAWSVEVERDGVIVRVIEASDEHDALRVIGALIGMIVEGDL